MNAVEQEYAIRSNKTIGIRIWEKSGEKIRPRMQLRNTQKKTCAPHFRGHIPFEGNGTDANTRYFRAIHSSTFRPADRHGPKNGFRLFGHILHKFVYNTATGYYQHIPRYKETNERTNTRIAHILLFYICFTSVYCVTKLPNATII